MTTDNIIEVGIDNKERIYIKPKTKEYDFIWRDASEIGWVSNAFSVSAI